MAKPTSLCYFNVTGAEGNYGVCHPNETHIIPLALRATTSNDSIFTIFGNNYMSPDGTCIRDHIHVSDLADAHLLALHHGEAGTHKIYNLGNGNGYSNRQVIACVERVTGNKLDIKYAPKRAGDPAVLVSSSDKARLELDWKPQKSSLQVIVRDVWEFYKES